MQQPEFLSKISMLVRAKQDPLPASPFKKGGGAKTAPI
jgi:hypothetical protein